MKKTFKRLYLVFVFTLALYLFIEKGSPHLLIVCGFILAIQGIGFLLKKLMEGPKPNNNGLLGKAKFSTAEDLKKNGLTGNGIVFGKVKGQLIEKPPTKDGHVLVMGGTGTGKSRGHAIPTLIRWKGTGLAIDIKGELNQLTSHIMPSIVFSTKAQKARYNPLDWIVEIEDVQEMGRNIFPKPEKGDPFWAQSAQAIFSAACWEFKGKMSFSEVCQWLCSNPNEEIVKKLSGSSEMETKILISTVLNLKVETLGGIFAELRGKLATIAIDKNIQYATSRSDFSPNDIESNMIFLEVAEHQIKQFGAVFTVIVGQFLRHLTRRAEHQNPPVLVLLDEFPRLGKMSEIVGGLATLRSRNVHLMLIIQSLSQLDSIYSKEERKVIVDNCGYKLVLNATDVDTQKYLSDMAGQTSAQIKSYSSDIKSIRVNTQEQTVPLIRPEEFGILEKPILFPYGLRPIELERSFWDEDKQMRNLVHSGNSQALAK